MNNDITTKINADKIKQRKSFEKSINPINGAGGSHGEVYLVKKIKSNKTYSTYVHKKLTHRDNPYIASVEAAAGDLYNFIAPNITPKVRVVTKVDEQTSQRSVSAVVSKHIKGYKEAYKISDDEMQNLMQDKSYQLAALFTSAFVLEEDDLHNGNWGVNENGDVVKIDNDRVLFSKTASYKGYDIQQNRLNSDDLIKWPNTKYAIEDRFKNLSINDIKSLPKLTDQKPSNHPVHATQEADDISMKKIL